MPEETRSTSNGRPTVVLLESLLCQMLGRRIPGLTVRSNDGQLVVGGRVHTYYALQLTLGAINDVLQETNGEVSVTVCVGDVTRELQFAYRQQRNGER